MKILFSAFACEPGKGSEEGTGWNLLRQMARYHDVWVLTRGEGRHGIEAALASEALPRIRFVYIDPPSWALFWTKVPQAVQLHYYLWQIAAYVVGRRLHRKVDFDLIHHVTWMRYWMPSFLGLLPIPFIWGPVGGGESVPRAFYRSFSLHGKIFEFVRDLARIVGEHAPFSRSVARRAALSLATTEESAERMRDLGCRRVSVHSALGLDQQEIRRLSSIPLSHSTPFRVISIGRLEHWKGYHLGLRAFAEFHCRFPESEYWLFGEGPEYKRLRKLSEGLGVAGSVTFWGNVPRREVLEKLSDCAVLLHPSLHDSGGWACLEAMAAGRPVVCLDLGGPALHVTEKTGIKVSASTPDEATSDLAKAILRLAEDPELRVHMAQASRQRVEAHFSWTSKGEFMNGIYESAVGAEASASLTGCDSVGEEAD